MSRNHIPEYGNVLSVFMLQILLLKALDPPVNGSSFVPAGSLKFLKSFKVIDFEGFFLVR